ncbi:cell division protein FtsZ [Amylibacter marinus]|uniref:Cell division protein FtsZ n=1 Tax=Amylibacter marinus TaxID=1475483 RepID=A0ABQ5VUK9_9RHOB|nr:cell division protein FtsZ [Amylibacter marinus]GLQ34862.1 cell division protein FtsZ [Amylibacter marinus]
MTLNLQMPEVADLCPKITVFGVGGAGCNAVNNMIDKNLAGVDFLVANTDAQALQLSKAPVKIQLGEKSTEGLGAGARPQVGAIAAEESIETIVDHLAGSHMCFITAGMGGGTGTGAAPIIAQAARELGILTVGVVTKPFQFEGAKRARQADDGVEALQKVVDTLIIIPNQNLFRIANEKTTFTEAFSLADDVLYQGVKGVTDLMVRPGIINLDFADIRVVMDEMGKAMMGTGEAAGEDRAIQAAEQAINNPLLDEISLDGARGVLINITGGDDLTLFEVDEAANRIRDKVDPNANILVGSALDDTLDGNMRVSVVATGIDAVERVDEVPVPRRTLKSPLPLKVEELKVEEPAPAPAAAAPAPSAPVAQQPRPTMEAELPPQFHDTVAQSSFDMPEFEAQPHAVIEDPLQEDGLPAPAYQAPAEPAPIAQDYAPVEENVATPSLETMARLNAAVQKQPKTEARPAAEPRVSDADLRQQMAPEKKGVLGGLISRMTGAPAAAEQPSFMAQHRSAPALNEEPQFSTDYDEMDPQDEQVEVPAFLRRQAN